MLGFSIYHLCGTLGSMKTAIQGIVGSFHHQAAAMFFGDEAEIVECKTFRDVFTAVQSGQAQRGIVAVENSLHGSINPVYRLLAEQKLWVCGEVRLKIDLYLIGTTDASTASVEEVSSQAEALSQCEDWLNTNLPTAHRQEMPDTAESVRTVARNANPAAVAVASKAAAEQYDAKLLAGPINDDPDNYTRFFVLAKEAQATESAGRTSIIITETTDQPGKLYTALGLFKDASINLSKLDSHPLPGRQRRYAFYLDIDAGLASVQPLLDELTKQDWQVQILGSYPPEIQL